MAAPEAKGHLVIAPETADAVRRILGYAMENKSSNYIHKRLEEDRIPCPTWWNRQRGYRNHTTKWEEKDPENGKYVWDFGIIEGILCNPVYYGGLPIIADTIERFGSLDLQMNGTD